MIITQNIKTYLEMNNNKYSQSSIEIIKLSLIRIQNFYNNYQETGIQQNIQEDKSYSPSIMIHRFLNKLYLQRILRRNIPGMISLLDQNESQIMMQCSKKRSFCFEESKTREIAEQYLAIEENTEYLTHLKRWQSHRPRIPLKLQHLCEFGSWAAVVVQLSYLLFTCYVKQINILVLRTPCLLFPGRLCKQKQIFLQYLIKIQYEQLNSQLQQVIDKHFEHLEFSSNKGYKYCNLIVDKINYLIDLVGGQFQIGSKNNQKTINKQFLSIKNIIRNYLRPIITILDKPQIVLQSLEESSLFREYSDLVKIINNSLFTNIRTKPKSVILKLLSIQKALKLAKINSYSLLYSKYMEKAIEEMFVFLAQQSIVKIEQSINQLFNINLRSETHGVMMTERTFFQKKFVLWQVEQQNNIRKLRCKIFIAEKQERYFDQYVLESLINGKITPIIKKNTEPSFSNEFLIEFVSQNGQISISYITDILLNNQNSDILAFQCNYIPYNWGIVKMQSIQKSKSKRIVSKEYYLGFTIKIRMHDIDNPLVQILLMIDILIVTARIAYPCLKRPILKASDYKFLDEISYRIYHMINLFIKKQQKYYQKMSESKQLGNCQKITL